MLPIKKVDRRRDKDNDKITLEMSEYQIRFIFVTPLAQQSIFSREKLQKSGYKLNR